MATVDKNFRIKNGLVVEGSTATVNGNDILAKNTQDGDSYIINLIGGTATPENTANTVVKRDANGNFAAGIITANIVGNVTGTVSDISNHSTSSLSEGTNLYFTNQRAIDANTGLWDTVGAAAAALSDAQDYADTAESDAVAASQSYTNAEITYALQTAQGYANTAESDAISAAAADATSKANAAESAAEATAQAALDDVLDGTTPFTDLNINDVAKQVAARTTSLGSVVVTAYQFNKSAFKSGKFLVKIDNGTHNEISEILVTLDSADNVAITEYAIVGTNGSRGTITADVDGTHCRIRVNPVNDSTITVSGTVFNA